MNKELSQEKLAALIPISRTYMGNIESGQKSASLEILIQISNALEISVEDILADSLEFTHLNHRPDMIDILSDCTLKETSILIENMNSLKSILMEYNIR